MAGAPQKTYRADDERPAIDHQSRRVPPAARPPRSSHQVKRVLNKLLAFNTPASGTDTVRDVTLTCRAPSKKLFLRYRITEFQPSSSKPCRVLFPVRVKSVFSAPVPEYAIEMKFA